MNKMPTFNGLLLLVFMFIFWASVNRRVTFWEVIGFLGLHFANLILNELQNISKALRK